MLGQTIIGTDRHHSLFLIIKDNTSSLMKPVSGLSMELLCEECNWQRTRRGLFPEMWPDTRSCNVTNGRELRRVNRSEVILEEEEGIDKGLKSVVSLLCTYIM